MLKIDHEFADQIPPLTDEEFEQLEANILDDGEVINPIIIWNGIIVDGHNRYRIIEEHPEIPYKTFEKKFSNRNEVMAWICRNQLGRRNLTPEQKKYLIGKQYHMEKATHGGDRKSDEAKSSYENRNLISENKTCEKVAKENHVGRNYVIQADHFASGVDTAEDVEPGIRQEILSGEICPIDSAVQAVAAAPPEERAELAKHLRDPEVQRRGKTRQKKKNFSHTKQTDENIEPPIPKHKVDENSMLESLRGVAKTMIRASNQCFNLFPTLLTEQQYREKVIEIMQEPKNFILNIEAGGELQCRTKN